MAKADLYNENGFELIEEILSSAKIKPDVQENKLHWLWVHNAGSTAISLAFQKYIDVEKYLEDNKLLKHSFPATLECLELCKKRGTYSKQYPELAAFKWPLWILIPMFEYNFRPEESMRRNTADGENMPMEDIV